MGLGAGRFHNSKYLQFSPSGRGDNRAGQDGHIPEQEVHVLSRQHICGISIQLVVREGVRQTCSETGGRAVALGAGLSDLRDGDGLLHCTTTGKCLFEAQRPQGKRKKPPVAAWHTRCEDMPLARHA